MTKAHTGDTPAPYARGFRDAVNNLPPVSAALNYRAGYAAGLTAMEES